MPKTPKTAIQKVPIERPHWVLDTPMIYYALEAYVSDLNCEPLRITLSIEEFDVLKKKLASMRGYAVPEVSTCQAL